MASASRPSHRLRPNRRGGQSQQRQCREPSDHHHASHRRPFAVRVVPLETHEIVRSREEERSGEEGASADEARPRGGVGGGGHEAERADLMVLEEEGSERGSEGGWGGAVRMSVLYECAVPWPETWG